MNQYTQFRNHLVVRQFAIQGDPILGTTLQTISILYLYWEVHIGIREFQQHLVSLRHLHPITL